MLIVADYSFSFWCFSQGRCWPLLFASVWHVFFWGFAGCQEVHSFEARMVEGLALLVCVLNGLGFELKGQAFVWEKTEKAKGWVPFQRYLKLRLQRFMKVVPSTKRSFSLGSRHRNPQKMSIFLGRGKEYPVTSLGVLLDGASLIYFWDLPLEPLNLWQASKGQQRVR